MLRPVHYLFSFIYVLISSYILVYGQNNFNELPHCVNDDNPGLILVSTLDGNVSALNPSGNLLWQIATGPGPLLASTIHTLELTNNGQWIRIIPSLSGTLYTFDGSNINAIPITAESLLKSSFRYSEDIVIAGGLEVRTYGITMKSGKVLYECNTLSCKNMTDHEYKVVEDTIVVERSTRMVRAIEPRTGIERWNFSVGQHNMKIPYISCRTTKIPSRIDLSAVLPDGILIAKFDDGSTWKYKFNSPIVNVWKWNGQALESVNLFKTILRDDVPTVAQGIYLGMHNKQLYIHESSTMLTSMESGHHQQVDSTVAESYSLAKIPWKPIPARDTAIEYVHDDSTAISVLYASEFVNGNGFYFYANEDLDKICTNKTIEVLAPPDEESDDSIMISIWHWWKEILVISLTTAIAFNIMCRSFSRDVDQNSKIIYVERHVEVPVKSEPVSRSTSESSDSTFTSRFTNDFETVSCLGKGGFGVVFEVKQKIDECNYAIKRITLPREIKSRDRVMREVKTLAKLDHQHIVRYFNSWVEHPPHGWEIEHDKRWVTDTNSLASTNVETTTSPSHRYRSRSVVIDVSHCEEAFDLNNTDATDSYIEFKNSEDEDNASCQTTTMEVESSTNTTISEHTRKKINWKRPRRRPHSLDITSNGLVVQQPPPPTFLYIQMQLCRKESLRDWLNKNKDRDPSIIWKYFEQIVSAVEYIHLQELIHRDLKPSNIFFSLEDQIKVGDFGLVADMSESLENELNVSSSSRGLTKGVGTRLYMSPEQLMNKRYNYKVDIFSLGLILFELLVPFCTEMERISVLTRVREKQYPKEFPKNYSKELELLNMMLCEEPKQRPTTYGVRALSPLKHDCSPEHHFELPLQKGCM